MTISPSIAASGARMDIPATSNCIGLVIGYSILLFFTACAVFNLVNFSSMSAVTMTLSGVWLLLAAVIVIASITDAPGVRQFLVDRLGEFSSVHFVEAIDDEDGNRLICFGFEMLGRRWHLLRIDADAVVSVDWRTGQASDIAGRDMDDWHVALWYRPPSGRPKYDFPDVRKEEIDIVGPLGPRKQIEPFGLQFVDLLVSIGVELKPGEEDGEFVRV